MEIRFKVKKLKLVFIIILTVFAGLWGIRIYNGYRHHVEKETRFMMDTYVTMYAVGPKAITSKAIGLALDRMQEIDVEFNSLNPKSPIYSFNHQGTPISDAEILDLIRMALKVSKESNGAFDITVAPLVELWGFYEKAPHLPQDQQIKDCLKTVGYQHISLENGKLEKEDYIKRPADTSAGQWYNICEDIVRREVLEETGIKIRNIKYLASLVFIRPDGIPVVVISLYGDYAGGEVKLSEEE